MGIFSSFDEPDEQDPTYNMFALRGGLPPEQQGPYDPPQPPAEAESLPAEPAPVDVASRYTAAPPPAIIPAQPMGDWAPHGKALTDLRAKQATENTKPSLGRKILAGVSAGMAGFGTRNAEAGARIGAGILNAPLENAETRWARQAAPLQQQITNDAAQDAQTRLTNQGIEQQNRANEMQYRTQVLQKYDQDRGEKSQADAAAKRNAITGFTPDDKGNRDTTGTGTTADGRTVKGVAAPAWWQTAWDRDPATKTAAALKEGQSRVDAIETPEGRPGTKIQLSDGKGNKVDGTVQSYGNGFVTVKGADGKLYRMQSQGRPLSANARASILSGRQIGPTEHTSTSIRENPDGSAVQPGTGRGGRGPVTHGTPAQFSALDKSTHEAYAKVEELYAKGLLTEAQLGEQKRQIAQTNSNQMRDLGGIPAEDGQAAPAAPAQVAQPVAQQAAPVAQRPAPQAVRVKSGKTVEIGHPVSFKGRNGIITGINPKTGKPIVRFSGAQ